tara:strand:- start:689 stop:991 length:303 start_codon:yes stop_codon:yes gene_type:complete
MLIKLDDIDKFQEVLNSVDQEMVPINYVKKVVFKLNGGKRRTLNLEVLRKQGLQIEDIETVVNKNMLDFGDSIINLDFVLDISAIAKKIKPLTKRYLDKL